MDAGIFGCLKLDLLLYMPFSDIARIHTTLKYPSPAYMHQVQLYKYLEQGHIILMILMCIFLEKFFHIYLSFRNVKQ